MKTLLDRDELVFNPPDLGCVLCLSGLPGGDSRVYDRSPYGNTGAITGAVWKRLAGGPWYLDFDGSDDYVDCGNGTCFDSSSQLSVEVWAYIDPLAPGLDGKISGIVTKSDRSQADKGFYLAFEDRGGASQTNALRWSVSNGLGDYGDRKSDNDITTAGWYHVVATYDKTLASANLKTFVNGRQLATTADFGSGIGSNTRTVKVGASDDGAGGATECFQGGITLARVHNRALTALEVQSHYDRDKRLLGG